MFDFILVFLFRKVVWKHLLNVYPEGMSGRERMDYIKKKATEYEKLRDTWKQAIAQVIIRIPAI